MVAHERRSPSPQDSVIHTEIEYTLMTGEAVALDLRPTGFVLRAAGTMIDFLVYLGLYIAVALTLFPLLIAAFGWGDAQTAALAITVLVVCIVIIPTTVELLSRGRSLGRLAVGARIVRDDGGAIGFRHAFIRSLLAVIEIYLSLGGIAALVGLLGGRSKRLGDLVAGTYSQQERVSGREAPLLGVPVELQHWAQTADVAAMPDQLTRRIARFVAQSGRLTPTTLERLATELAQEAARYTFPVPSAPAAAYLQAVVALRREREASALQREHDRLIRLEPALTTLPHGFPRR
jgi:uncharacterized RDD family membrane protein YckC